MLTWASRNSCLALAVWPVCRPTARALNNPLTAHADPSFLQGVPTDLRPKYGSVARSLMYSVFCFKFRLMCRKGASPSVLPQRFLHLDNSFLRAAAAAWPFPIERRGERDVNLAISRPLPQSLRSSALFGAGPHTRERTDGRTSPVRYF